ncbi:MAG: mRNA interferase RelE/StbE [Bacteroidota bacterium]|nr:mRNA interferase RelE/StbE [Bacteroidota bacterium]
MLYKIKLSNKVIKQLDKMQKEIYLKAYERLRNLSSDPRPNGCIKLTDSDEYRIKFGHYRIIYGINDKDKIVEIFDITHRKDAYRSN